MTLNSSVEIEQEMEKIQKEYQLIPESQHTPEEKHLYCSIQIDFMKLLLSKYFKSYSFTERMKLKAGIYVLEKTKNSIKI
jgi:hypothetical protein